MLASLVDRLIGRWLEGFRSHHDLRQSDLVNGPMGSAASGGSRLLHVGCGHQTIDSIPVAGFRSPEWQEVRLDADQSVHPDIVGTMTNMSAVPDGFADAIYSSHNIEHLYPHEVPVALAEFYRVLKSGGFLVVTCPDLQSLCRLIVDDKLDEMAYMSPAGPIAPIDVLYGHRPAMAAGNLYMAHRCGFTLTTLMAVLRDAGFAVGQGFQRPGSFDLWVLASKSHRTQDDMAALAKDYLAASN